MEKFKNKVALITGGNSGFGYATAKELIENGATVLITGRRKDAIETAAKELGAIPFVADQANLEDTDALAKAVKQQFGKIDILFINAGITGTLGPIEKADAENFDAVLGINFRGAYFMLSKFIPLLNEGASVVFLSSNVATTHKPNSSIYQASKAALNSIAKTAAAELAPRKIRVNIVSPGPHTTEIMKKAGLDEATLNGINDWLLDVIPLKKMGNPGDVGQLVAYLSSEAAVFITGSEFVVDGGMNL